MGEQVSSTQLSGGLAFRDLEFACPVCKRAVTECSEAYRCHPCRRDYPIISGIPDFRLKPDPFISIEADREKGFRVLRRCGDSSFAGALDAYYAMTPELPRTLADSYKAHQLAGERIGELTFRELARLGAGLTQESLLLDLGCGAGGFLAAASRGSMPAVGVPVVGVPVVGVDVAFRWLLIARLRLREAGFGALFVCANAEHLPFSPRTFDAVVASDLIEHVPEALPVFQECRRVTRPGGVGYFTTNNRYSLFGEPHVRLWGVGLLPRGLQQQYVRAFRGHAYENVRLLSAREIVGLARNAGLECRDVSPPPLYADHRGRAAAGLAGAYNRVRLMPGFRQVLNWGGPRLQLLCRTNQVTLDSEDEVCPEGENL